MSDEILGILQTAIADSDYAGRVFIVGGFVRDRLLGFESDDVDVMVVGGQEAGIQAAEFAAKRLSIFHEDSNPVVYRRHGTAMLHLSDHSRVEFTGAGDAIDRVLETDANRRDFTINALMQPLGSAEILDPTGNGRADIENRRLRTPIDPRITLEDDPLRMLRTFRFALGLGFKIDLDLLRAIKRAAPLLQRVSAERVREELVRLLLVDRPSRSIRLLQVTGLLNEVLPDIAAMDGVTQNRFHNRDVFRHTIAALDASPARINTRLGALFHDVGKPATRTEKGGKVQFIGHETAGGPIALRSMRRLKFPNDVIRDVAEIVERHMELKSGGPDSSGLGDGRLRRFINKVGVNLNDVLDVMHADNVSHSPEHSMPLQIECIRKRIADWDLDRYRNPDLPIDGHDVVNLGVEGRRVGEILERIT